MDPRVAKHWRTRPRSIGISLILSTIVHAVVADCVTRFGVVEALPEAVETSIALDVVEREVPPVAPPETVAVTTSSRSSPTRRAPAPRAPAESSNDATDDDAFAPRWDRFHVYEETLASPDAIASDVRLAPLRSRAPRAPRLGVPTRVTDDVGEVAEADEARRAELPAADELSAESESASHAAQADVAAAEDEATAVHATPPTVLVVRLAAVDAPQAVAIREALDLATRLRSLEVDARTLDRLIVVARGDDGSRDWLVAESLVEAGTAARSPVVEDVDRGLLRTRIGSRTVLAPREDAPALLAALSSASEDAPLALARLIAPREGDGTRDEDRALVIEITCAVDRDCTLDVAIGSRDGGALDATTIDALESRDPDLAARLAPLVAGSTRLAAEP